MPSHAMLLVDVHVGCTPYTDRIRIGGTMEFSGINNRLDRRRIDSIVAGAPGRFHRSDPPDRGRVGRHAADRRRWSSGARPCGRLRTCTSDRLRDAGCHARSHLRPGARRDGRDGRRPAMLECSVSIVSRGCAISNGASLHPSRSRTCTVLGPPAAPVAIIGSGNIGTHLIIKGERSPLRQVVGVAGIDPDSNGKTKGGGGHGQIATDEGLPELPALASITSTSAFDATSAGAHPEHAPAAGRARHSQRRSLPPPRLAWGSCRP